LDWIGSAKNDPCPTLVGSLVIVLLKIFRDSDREKSLKIGQYKKV